jgi:hypothetical protein
MHKEYIRKKTMIKEEVWNIYLHKEELDKYPEILKLFDSDSEAIKLFITWKGVSNLIFVCSMEIITYVFAVRYNKKWVLIVFLSLIANNLILKHHMTDCIRNHPCRNPNSRPLTPPN